MLLLTDSCRILPELTEGEPFSEKYFYHTIAVAKVVFQNHPTSLAIIAVQTKQNDNISKRKPKDILYETTNQHLTGKSYLLLPLSWLYLSITNSNKA